MLEHPKTSLGQRQTLSYVGCRWNLRYLTRLFELAAKQTLVVRRIIETRTCIPLARSDAPERDDQPSPRSLNSLLPRVQFFWPGPRPALAAPPTPRLALHAGQLGRNGLAALSNKQTLHCMACPAGMCGGLLLAGRLGASRTVS